MKSNKVVNEITRVLVFDGFRLLKDNQEFEIMRINIEGATKQRFDDEIIEYLVKLFDNYTLSGSLSLGDSVKLASQGIDHSACLDVFDNIFKNMIVFKKCSNSVIIRIYLNMLEGNKLSYPYRGEYLLDNKNIIIKDETLGRIEEKVNKIKGIKDKSEFHWAIIKIGKLLKERNNE